MKPGDDGMPNLAKLNNSFGMRPIYNMLVGSMQNNITIWVNFLYVSNKHKGCFATQIFISSMMHMAAKKYIEKEHTQKSPVKKYFIF
jgi:hypothetical protein